MQLGLSEQPAQSRAAYAYAGFNRLYEASRRPGPIMEAACWSHGRRKFYVLADVTAKARGKLAVIAPLAPEGG